jgi:methylthioribose-1-phosphate isomerase
VKTLDEIDRLVVDLKQERGTVIEPLTDAVRELRRHTESIEKIEANTEAIREEVLAPTESELAASRKAGGRGTAMLYLLPL